MRDVYADSQTHRIRWNDGEAVILTEEEVLVLIEMHETYHKSKTKEGK